MEPPALLSREGASTPKSLTPPWTAPPPLQERGPLSKVSAHLESLGQKPLHDDFLLHVSLKSDLSNEHREELLLESSGPDFVPRGPI